MTEEPVNFDDLDTNLDDTSTTSKKSTSAFSTVPNPYQSWDDKLFSASLMRNQTRKNIKTALDTEVFEAKEGQGGKRKREQEEEGKKKGEFEGKLKDLGVDPQRYYRLHQTLENQDISEKIAKNKKKPKEIDIYSDEAQYKSFKRRRDLTNFSKEEYDKQKRELGQDFFRGTQNLNYGTDTKDSEARVEGLVKELKDQVERRHKFSRRRTWYEDRDIDFINERNRKFNAKVARAFNPYTTEIRENLERGTAL